MDKLTKISLTLLRAGVGFLFLYAGASKIVDPAWSAAGYLNSAKTFPALFQWFASPSNISWVNLLNEWGLALIGISLILGALVRWSSLAGMLLMILYYFPILSFPYAGAHYYIVDDHVIYFLIFMLLFAVRAGETYGLDRYLRR